MKLGVVTEFDAAHSLPGYQGKCAHMHGHTYHVEIVLEGEVGAGAMLCVSASVAPDLSRRLSRCKRGRGAVPLNWSFG